MLSILLKSYWNVSPIVFPFNKDVLSILLKSYWNRADFSFDLPITLLYCLNFIRFSLKGQ